jgi:predicted nucleic acid-binding protein
MSICHGCPQVPSLIVAAAYSKNATLILTEDLNDGQQIEGIMIRNPLLEVVS